MFSWFLSSLHHTQPASPCPHHPNQTARTHCSFSSRILIISSAHSMWTAQLFSVLERRWEMRRQGQQLISRSHTHTVLQFCFVWLMDHLNHVANPSRETDQDKGILPVRKEWRRANRSNESMNGWTAKGHIILACSKRSSLSIERLAERSPLICARSNRIIQIWILLYSLPLGLPATGVKCLPLASFSIFLIYEPFFCFLDRRYHSSPHIL